MSAMLTLDDERTTQQTREGVADTTVLIVDDSAAARRFVGRLVQRRSEFRVLFARNGREALTILKKEPCAVVVTDLYMPEMDGLELVEMIRDRHPLVPVVLMTAQGSEETAFKALRAGASSYVPKHALERNLLEILDRVLATAKVDRRRQGLLECVSALECRFVLENDPALVPILVAHLQEYMVRMKLCDSNGRIRLGVALEESLLNGLYHGNLELSSDMRQDGGDAYERLAEERRYKAPYAGRRLHVHAKLDATAAVFVIRDEGPGFDLSTVPDPTDPENFTKPSGRGLLLIRTFMDEATHNATGNEITLIRRRR
jgi:CheY-like chemotaxis protein